MNYFGAMAVKAGYLTEDQLTDALKIQLHEVLNGGEHRPVGAICLELGYLNIRQIDAILHTQYPKSSDEEQTDSPLVITSEWWEEEGTDAPVNTYAPQPAGRMGFNFNGGTMAPSFGGFAACGSAGGTQSQANTFDYMSRSGADILRVLSYSIPATFAGLLLTLFYWLVSQL